MFSCTSARTSCYAGCTFSCTSAHTSCYAGCRFSCISAHPSCYAGYMSCYAGQCNHSKGVWCVEKRVGSRGLVSVHTGGIDNWWKLAKALVPNAIPTTRGSMKVNWKIFRYIQSFQWRWEQQKDLLNCTAKYIKQLSWYAPEEKNNKPTLLGTPRKSFTLKKKSETPFLSQKMTFRCSETMILSRNSGR